MPSALRMRWRMVEWRAVVFSRTHVSTRAAYAEGGEIDIGLRRHRRRGGAGRRGRAEAGMGEGGAEGGDVEIGERHCLNGDCSGWAGMWQIEGFLEEGSLLRADLSRLGLGTPTSPRAFLRSRRGRRRSQAQADQTVWRGQAGRHEEVRDVVSKLRCRLWG